MTTFDPIRNVPDALLLDFGGVIFETEKVPDGKRRLADALGARLERARIAVPANLEESLTAGLTALKHWKHAQSRRPEPLELAPREIVGDFLAADLPVRARALLVAEASDVLLEVTTTISEHAVRPGIRELLELADAQRIPVGIVSNAHSGRSHRRVLAAHGLGDRFVVQCYSDEVGLRKPHPGIIELAATACGTTTARSWYVGDTQDRDVVAGRRAGVGAVILTRSHHTDAPPFAVDGEADAVFDTPEGLTDALRAAIAHAGGAAPGDRAAGAGQEAPAGALLIDHGGVISTSAPDAALLDEFTEWLAGLLAPPSTAPDEDELTAADAADLIRRAREAHRSYKRAVASRAAARDEPVTEADPVEFWRDWFGATLSERRRAVLQAEALDVMARYGRAKSRRTLRSGVRELLEQAGALGYPVVVVSNTVSGLAVRAECAAHGLDDLIGAYVCSDEVGLRKPDAALVREALAIAGVDPADAWFLGDKPQNDAIAARAAGVGRRVIVRGGTTGDDAVAAALDAGLATDVVDEPGDVAALLLTSDSPSVTAVPAP